MEVTVGTKRGGVSTDLNLAESARGVKWSRDASNKRTASGYHQDSKMTSVVLRIAVHYFEVETKLEV